MIESMSMMPPDEDSEMRTSRTLVRRVRSTNPDHWGRTWTTAAAVICLLLMGCASPTAAQPQTAEMGAAFTVDGYTVTLTSLRTIRQVKPNMVPLANTELWVLGITIVNHTGGEQRIGSGFRLQDDQGVIADAELITAVDPVFGGTLASGGQLSGYLTFSLGALAAPTAILVKPAASQVTISLPYTPWPLNRASSAS